MVVHPPHPHLTDGETEAQRGQGACMNEYMPSQLGRAGVFAELRNKDKGHPCGVSPLAGMEDSISTAESEMSFSFSIIAF